MKQRILTLLDNSEKLNIKVSQELKEKLQGEAIKNGWSLSKESRFRLASSLSSDPALYPDEVAELRRARNAVDVVGRNLHYIISKKQMLTSMMMVFLKTCSGLMKTLKL
ncbi:uncharacterized protein TNCV_4379541 [Trichonephila clavipes]|nr:uncharacterized protein TNCV_4379541 [Trichonephila clavipes]